MRRPGFEPRICRMTVHARTQYTKGSPRQTYLYCGKCFLVVGARDSWNATGGPSLAFISEPKALRGRLFRDLDVGMLLSATEVHGFSIRCGCGRK